MRFLSNLALDGQSAIIAGQHTAGKNLKLTRFTHRILLKRVKALLCILPLLLIGVLMLSSCGSSSGTPISDAPLTLSTPPTSAKVGWPRDSYTGPGGGLYTGPGGGAFIGPGGGAFIGPGGGEFIGPGGGEFIGPGGGLSSFPGGGLSTESGGGLSTGPGGGLSTEPGGGLYTGPGGGLYTGKTDNPYYSNLPPREIYLQYLDKNGPHDIYLLLKQKWGL